MPFDPCGRELIVRLPEGVASVDSARGPPRDAGSVCGDLKTMKTATTALFVLGTGLLCAPAAAQTTSQPTYTWNTVEGATEYELWVSVDATPNTALIDILYPA